MRNLSFLPAESVPLADRAALLNDAYADYFVPMHLTIDAMQAVDQFYDVDLARSAVAQVGREAVGIAFLSRRGDRGWISGVGVLPAWRRRGIARALMNILLDGAREAGIACITLEAIVQNQPARALYRTLGFAEGRELLSWRFPADSDALPIPAERLIHAPVEKLLAYFDRWHDQPACWQSEVATLRKMAARMRGYRLDLDEIPAGYCLVSERGDSVALMDVDIAPGIARAPAGLSNAGGTLLQALSAL